MTSKITSGDVQYNTSLLSAVYVCMDWTSQYEAPGPFENEQVSTSLAKSKIARFCRIESTKSIMVWLKADAAELYICYPQQIPFVHFHQSHFYCETILSKRRASKVGGQWHFSMFSGKKNHQYLNEENGFYWLLIKQTTQIMLKGPPGILCCSCSVFMIMQS